MLLISIGTVLSFGFSLGIPAVLSRELIFDENRSAHLKKLSAGYQALMIWSAAIIYFITLFINFAPAIKMYAVCISSNYLNGHSFNRNYDIAKFFKCRYL
jgi:hypothetical protein